MAALPIFTALQSFASGETAGQTEAGKYLALPLVQKAGKAPKTVIVF